MSAAKLPDLRECVGCEVTHEGTELDPKGRCGAPGAEGIPEPKVVDPYLREHLTPSTVRHQRRVLARGTLVCRACDIGVFFLDVEAA